MLPIIIINITIIMLIINFIMRNDFDVRSQEKKQTNFLDGIWFNGPCDVLMSSNTFAHWQ